MNHSSDAEAVEIFIISIGFPFCLTMDQIKCEIKRLKVHIAVFIEPRFFTRKSSNDRKFFVTYQFCLCTNRHTHICCDR